MKFSWLFLCALVCGTAFSSVHGLFKDGDTAVFLGDSITHNGGYLLYLRDFYTTRYPQSAISIVNAGVGGDTAFGCGERFPADVTDWNPTAVAVMFGMNDCGIWLYNQEPDDKLRALRLKQMEEYRLRLDELHRRIARECPKASRLYMTPTPYDEWSEATNLPPIAAGYGEALGNAAEIVRQQARKDGATLVDFYARTRDELMKSLARDRSYSFCPIDRVHPAVEGNYLMAIAFLSAQGAGPVVSGVTVDALGGKAQRCENAEVEEIATRADGGVAFTVLERSLPLPVTDECQARAEEWNVYSLLNGETLAVNGLFKGEWTLKIDGETILTTNEVAWHRGVNLARFRTTPQFRQAMSVHAKLLEAFQEEVKLRRISATRWFLGKSAWKDIRDDYAKVAELVAKWKRDGITGYYETECVPYYPDDAPRQSELRKHMLALEEEARQLAHPKKHRYQLICSSSRPLVSIAPAADAVLPFREKSPYAVSLVWRYGQSPFIVEIRRQDGVCTYRREALAKREQTVENLEVGCRYQWTVTDATGARCGGSFTTDSIAPRHLNAGRIENVRDLGGWKGLDGRRVRQGMVICSSQFNEKSTPSPEWSGHIRNQSVRDLLNRQIALLEREISTLKGHDLPVYTEITNLPFGMVKGWKFSAPLNEAAALKVMDEIAELGKPSAADGWVEFERTLVAKKSASGKDILELGLPTPGGTAFFLYEIDSPNDCIVPIKASGDWFWALAVNGCLLGNRLGCGNNAPADEPTHHVSLHLRSGRNRILLAVTSGRDGLSWCVGTDNGISSKIAVETQLRQLAGLRDSLRAWLAGYEIGPTRIGENDLTFWHDTLKIRTDLDLRSEDECAGLGGSPLGDRVNWIRLTAAEGAKAVEDAAGRKATAEALRVFLRREHYPVALHCVQGGDRTKTIAFLLNAILGVNLEDLRRNWQPNSSAPADCECRRQLAELEKALARYPGETVREQSESFVKSLGLTSEEIATIRDILLLPAAPAGGSSDAEARQR